MKKWLVAIGAAIAAIAGLAWTLLTGMARREKLKEGKKDQRRVEREIRDHKATLERVEKLQREAHADEKENQAQLDQAAAERRSDVESDPTPDGAARRRRSAWDRLRRRRSEPPTD